MDNHGLHWILPLVVLSAPACDGSVEESWQPLEVGVATSWERAEDLCGPLLQRGQAAVLAEGPTDYVDSRGPYDLCMKQQGWILRSEADHGISEALRREVDEFLDREVKPRPTKGELGSAFGAPVCYGAPPGTEICGPAGETERDVDTETCVWEFDYHSRVAEQRFAVVLTCLLPDSGAPRYEGSCQFDAK